jgi:hypothetical protein
MAIWEQQKRGKYKQTYLIERDSIEELNKRIDEINEEIKQQIDKALLSFVKEFNIKVESKPYWVRHEEYIKGEEYIDKLPKDLIIHDTVFKKVYGSGVEFINPNSPPGIEVKNYIKNRALEDISPKIVEALNELGSSYSKIAEDVLKPLTYQIQLHLKVQRKTYKYLKAINEKLEKENKTLDWLKQNIFILNDVLKYKDVIKGLPLREREDLSLWIINKFGFTP